MKLSAPACIDDGSGRSPPLGDPPSLFLSKNPHQNYKLHYALSRPERPSSRCHFCHEIIPAKFEFQISRQKQTLRDKAGAAVRRLRRPGIWDDHISLSVERHPDLLMHWRLYIRDGRYVRVICEFMRPERLFVRPGTWGRRRTGSAAAGEVSGHTPMAALLTSSVCLSVSQTQT